jgi:hypothetical protein
MTAMANGRCGATATFTHEENFALCPSYLTPDVTANLPTVLISAQRHEVTCRASHDGRSLRCKHPRPRRMLGAVAICVGIGLARSPVGQGYWIRRRGQSAGQRACGLASAIRRLCAGDLTGGEQRSAQHRGGLGGRQNRLGLDAALELLMEPFDRIGGACALPLAERQPGKAVKRLPLAKAGAKSRSPAFSSLSATALQFSLHLRMKARRRCSTSTASSAGL